MVGPTVYPVKYFKPDKFRKTICCVLCSNDQFFYGTHENLLLYICNKKLFLKKISPMNDKTMYNTIRRILKMTQNLHIWDTLVDNKTKALNRNLIAK